MLNSLSVSTDLSGLAYHRPRQETFFDVHDQPPEKWAWIVLVRTKYFGQSFDAQGEWGEWTILPDRPNHYRTRAGAEHKVAESSIMYQRKIDLCVVEFKIEPKYIGYVPGKDEGWISD